MYLSKNSILDVKATTVLEYISNPILRGKAKKYAEIFQFTGVDWTLKDQLALSTYFWMVPQKSYLTAFFFQTGAMPVLTGGNSIFAVPDSPLFLGGYRGVDDL